MSLGSCFIVGIGTLHPNAPLEKGSTSVGSQMDIEHSVCTETPKFTGERPEGGLRSLGVLFDHGNDEVPTVIDSTDVHCDEVLRCRDDR